MGSSGTFHCGRGLEGGGGACESVTVNALGHRITHRWLLDDNERRRTPVKIRTHFLGGQKAQELTSDDDSQQSLLLVPFLNGVESAQCEQAVVGLAQTFSVVGADLELNGKQRPSF